MTYSTIREKQYTREQLLDVINDYLKMINRSGSEFPTVVLDDIAKSIQHVLRENGRCA